MIIDRPPQMPEDSGTGRLTHLHQVVFYKIMKFQTQQLPRVYFPNQIDWLNLTKWPFRQTDLAISSRKNAI
jgi:hypothetical protein